MGLAGALGMADPGSGGPKTAKLLIMPLGFAQLKTIKRFECFKMTVTRG